MILIDAGRRGRLGGLWRRRWALPSRCHRERSVKIQSGALISRILTATWATRQIKVSLLCKYFPSGPKPPDRSNLALRVLVQWRPGLDATGQVEFAFRMHFHRRPRLDAAGQSNSLTGCLSTGGQNWTPLDKPNSLSGCLSTGGQDWTPLDKSNSLSGCLSNGGHGWTPLDKSNFALRVLVQWRPRLDDAGQVKFAFRALVHRRPGLDSNGQVEFARVSALGSFQTLQI